MTTPIDLTEAERDARSAFRKQQRRLSLAIVAWVGVAALCVALAVVSANPGP